MDPVSQTPTEPVDYAAISATYGALLGTLVLAARERGGDPVHGAELAPLGLAAFALSKLVAKEKAETWLRQPFVEERPDGKRPRGRRLRYAVGELLNCTRCMGAWSALGLVALRMYSPPAGRAVTTVLAASAGNDVLHTAFSLLCAKANAAHEREEQLGEELREIRTSRQAA